MSPCDATLSYYTINYSKDYLRTVTAHNNWEQQWFLWRKVSLTFHPSISSVKFTFCIICAWCLQKGGFFLCVWWGRKAKVFRDISFLEHPTGILHLLHDQYLWVSKICPCCTFYCLERYRIVSWAEILRCTAYTCSQKAKSHKSDVF